MSAFETIQVSQEVIDAVNAEFGEFDMTGWCECEMESDPLFHDNSVMPMDNCVEKHHYHCGWCLGLIQIG